MEKIPGASGSATPIDDKESIQRFLDAMVRRNLTAFTHSKPSSTVKSGTAETQIGSAVNTSNAKLSESDVRKKSDTQILKGGVDLQAEVAKSQLLAPSIAKREGGLSKAFSSLSPTESDMVDTPVLSPTTTSTSKQASARPDSVHAPTNKTVTSPLISGLRAPPPTPDTVPTDIKKIIVDAFGDLHVGSPPHLVLGASRHPYPNTTTKDKMKENAQVVDDKADMPRFFSPAKFLSPEEKQKRDESFQRVLALTSPRISNGKENKKTPTSFSMGWSDDGKGLLVSRWAENRGESSEQRKPGSAAIPIVDPISRNHTPAVSNTILSTSTTASQPISAAVEPASILNVNQTAENSSMKVMQINTTATVTANATAEADTLKALPADKGQSSDAPTTGTTTATPGPGRPSNTTPGFKTFEASVDPNQNKQFFSAWPKLTGRDAPRTIPPISSSLRKRLADLQILAARIRRVELGNLPRDSSAKFVQSLVFGGSLELLTVRSTSASVVFLQAEDCIKYYDATSNGLVYKEEDGKEGVCFVELAKDVDVVGGLLRSSIELGVTRCVRATGAEEEWGLPALWKMAGRKNRKVEHVTDRVLASGVGCSSLQVPIITSPTWLTSCSKARVVNFRFTNIQDAVRFKGVLARDEEWEYCNITYADDPQVQPLLVKV